MKRVALFWLYCVTLRACRRELTGCNLRAYYETWFTFENTRPGKYTKREMMCKDGFPLSRKLS